MNSTTYAEKLRLAHRLTEPAIRQAIQALGFPDGSAGLDAGCGIAQQTLLLADAIGPNGTVFGLDISTDNLTVARELLVGSVLSQRIHLVEGNLLSLPFHKNSLDWAWCADTLWPAIVAADPVETVRDLAGVVRPGGKIALLYWSGHSLLPGYPMLEARLNSAYSAAVPYLGNVLPKLHIMRALGWLRAAGLDSPIARSFLSEVQAPIMPDLRDALAYCYAMVWGGLESRVSRQDWRAYQHLCSPTSSQFIADNPDYYGFVTYTLFSGTVVSLT